MASLLQKNLIKIECKNWRKQQKQNNINILNLFCLVVDLYESINFNELLFRV